jgi:hypothetical protein
MIITQMHLVLGRIRDPFKMCSFVTPHNAKVLREHAIGMLNAGMSPRADARELNCSFLYHKLPQISF